MHGLQQHFVRAILIASSFVLLMECLCRRHKSPGNDKQMIVSAMSAAPDKVAKGATIMAMEAGSKMRTLREGTNGFTCMPDNPATPGPDPMCMDKNAMEWVHAWIAHTAHLPAKSASCTWLSGERMPAIPTRMRPSPSPIIIGSRPGRT